MREVPQCEETRGGIVIEHTFAEIARSMGISHQRVHQLYNNAMRKLSAHEQGREFLRALDDERSMRSRSSRYQEVPRDAYEIV